MMVYEMLTEAKLRTLKPEAKLYKITDRDGLYIAVAPSGRITFRYNYRINGRQETLTLGRYGYPDGMSLSEARDKLVRAKEELQKGVSPSRKKTREKRAVALEDSFKAWAKLWFEKYQQAESTKDMRLAIYNRDIEPRFGDFTPLPNGTLAPNGFAALAAFDSNGDGILDAPAPAFAELKLWRDTSQDGRTGEGELISLADAGIVSLNLANTLKNQNLANGNQLTREGSFTRLDGTTGGMGEFRLAIDTFDTRFAEEIDVPEALKTLPNMQGAGKVRELHQAAAQSGNVAGVLAQFQGAPTRTKQQALLDQLLTVWADTSGMAESLEERASGTYRIVYEAFGNERRSSSIDTAAFAALSSGSVGGSGAALMTDAGAPYLSEHYRNLISEWSRKLHVLEAFNGQYFFNLPDKKSQTAGANWGLAISAGSGGSGSGAVAIASLPTLRVNFSQAQLDLLQQAYDSLKESVYASLVLQTPLKPYLDQIELVIDEQGLRLDATQLNQMLAARKAADPENYLADFDALVETLPQTAGITALLDEFKVRTLTGGDDNAYLANNADIVLAGDGKSRRWRYGECANDEMWRVLA
jgi:hypothetical protein